MLCRFLPMLLCAMPVAADDAVVLLLNLLEDEFEESLNIVGLTAHDSLYFFAL